jgi:hypothetical protein
MQVRLPVRILLQIFGHMLRQQNVSGITAVHDPLCHVDSSSSHVPFSRYVDHTTNRSAVYAHSQPELRMLLERAANFQRAFDGRFRAVIKNQRDPVACRDFNQTPRCLRGLEFIRATDNFV